jgi:hypothetical protein
MYVIALANIEHTEYAGRAVRQIFFQIGLVGVGIYLIQRANKKKREREEKEKWNSGRH